VTCDASRSSDIGSSKVPEVTLAFGVIKVSATTLGKTGEDALSIAMHLGYALSSADFADRSLGIGYVGGSLALLTV
jgi:uncharacterized membrane-anchored protein